jgi:hypothetical protein
MSRAMNLDVAETSVVSTCEKLGIRISTIESLPQKGTRVVCSTSVGAHELRKAFAKQIIEGRVQRNPITVRPSAR